MKKSKKIFLIVLLLLFLSAFVLSAFKLWSYYSQRIKEQKIVDSLVESYQKEVVSPDDICPIEIDFEGLQKENPDVVGWIYCDGLSINYPVVKGKNNEEYLHKSFEGKWTFGGTLFIDCDNNADFSDFNTIIYGHNMKNGSMFHNIIKYRKQKIYDENKTMWLLTPKKNYKLDVFSAMTMKPDSRCYGKFDSLDKMRDYARNLKEKSDFDCDEDVSRIDNLLTLSTCTYEFRNARYAVFCKLTEVSV